MSEALDWIATFESAMDCGCRDTTASQERWMENNWWEWERSAIGQRARGRGRGSELVTHALIVKLHVLTM